VGDVVANSMYAFCSGKTHTSSFARIQGKKQYRKTVIPPGKKQCSDGTTMS
jgi:hypothetical protein